MTFGRLIDINDPSTFCCPYTICARLVPLKKSRGKEQYFLACFHESHPRAWHFFTLGEVPSTSLTPTPRHTAPPIAQAPTVAQRLPPPIAQAPTIAQGLPARPRRARCAELDCLRSLNQNCRHNRCRVHCVAIANDCGVHRLARTSDTFTPEFTAGLLRPKGVYPSNKQMSMPSSLSSIATNKKLHSARLSHLSHLHQPSLKRNVIGNTHCVWHEAPPHHPRLLLSLLLPLAVLYSLLLSSCPSHPPRLLGAESPTSNSYCKHLCAVQRLFDEAYDATAPEPTLSVPAIQPGPPSVPTSGADTPVDDMPVPQALPRTNPLAQLAQKMETLAARFRRSRRKEQQFSVANLEHALDTLLLQTDNCSVLPASTHAPATSNWKVTQAAMMPGIKTKRKRAGDPAYGAGASSGSKRVKSPSQSASGPPATAPPILAAPPLALPQVQPPPATAPAITRPPTPLRLLATAPPVAPSKRVYKARALRTTQPALPGTFVFYVPPQH
ncbi:hypothetical protein B0H12DRAFT_1067032 [Mycena haematopus]|nr:hypothetical protein B0H12DRAFT_1067032 [Mycena haematopus]